MTNLNVPVYVDSHLSYSSIFQLTKEAIALLIAICVIAALLGLTVKHTNRRFIFLSKTGQVILGMTKTVKSSRLLALRLTFVWTCAMITMLLNFMASDVAIRIFRQPTAILPFNTCGDCLCIYFYIRVYPMLNDDIP